MSTTELRISYEPDDDYCGRLICSVASQGFAGHGTAWFDRVTVKESFIDQLHRYPLTEQAPTILEGGFFPESGSETLQCHVRVSVSPFDGWGRVLVCVELASEAPRSPRNDLQQSVTTRFLVEYAALPHFANELESVLNGHREFAVLQSVRG